MAFEAAGEIGLVIAVAAGRTVTEESRRALGAAVKAGATWTEDGSWAGDT